MYTDNDTYGVTSVLTYGIMWDETLKFIKDKVNVTTSISWGNYYDSTFSFTGRYCIYSNNKGSWSEWVTNQVKEPKAKWLLTTGASETNKAKNIYDLAGNLFELVMEIRKSDNMTVRGGEFSNEKFCGAYVRAGNTIESSFDNIGFRPSLYINL